MILFPNCKINIGLNIIRKRPDGYHDLESVFYPIPLKDIIEIVPAESFQFNISSGSIPGDHLNNSCVKAYQYLKEAFPDLPGVNMYLYKNIPTGAGLGGGSADGAFMLRLLNDKFNLNLTTDQLIDYALRIGSDSPFFILNKPAFVSGRGEYIEHFPLDLSLHTFVLVHPGIHISTSWAFSKIKPGKPGQPLREILQQPIKTWQHLLTNDFETPVFTAYPFLSDIKKKLYESGALYASMTGSGSSFYGVFEKNAVPSFSYDPNFRVDILK